MLNTEKTNKILAILTILFTLSIPETVICKFLRNEYSITWFMAFVLHISLGPIQRLLFLCSFQ